MNTGYWWEIQVEASGPPLSGKAILAEQSENRFPPSPPVYYMAPSIRVFYSQRSGHNPSLQQTMSQA